ncbi:hypothetical Protein YC6258_02741 [Gynuella sunshinyii YC6258]|uniref:Uncharacterized protein n=1 Tax=Gynuella sunshinyii YC6258 TaxID=1445510 RepID=A0A0C5VWJ3_9GAMM|nr:hypothetical Protein YC6258_02741 [Gynuella sunshinyii YC6258]
MRFYRYHFYLSCHRTIQLHFIELIPLLRKFLMHIFQLITVWFIN